MDIKKFYEKEYTKDSISNSASWVYQLWYIEKILKDKDIKSIKKEMYRIWKRV